MNIYIDDYLFDKRKNFGAWVNSMHELFTDNFHEFYDNNYRENYSRMIGDVPEMVCFNNLSTPEYILHIPLLAYFTLFKPRDDMKKSKLSIRKIKPEIKIQRH